MSTLTENAQIIDQELNWLQTIIESRSANFLNRDDPNFVEQDANPSAPDISLLSTYYTDLIQKQTRLKNYWIKIAESGVLADNLSNVLGLANSRTGNEAHRWVM